MITRIPRSRLQGGTLATWIDINNASYDNKSLNVGATCGDPYAVFFTNEGMRMFVLNRFYVYSFTLTVAYDITTASYESKLHDCSAQVGSYTAKGLFVKDDGTTFYIVANGVYQYTMGTPYDLSTASYTSKSLATGDTQDLHISFDGLTLYTLDTATSGVITQYALGTAWDISTGSSTGKSFNMAVSYPYTFMMDPACTHFCAVGSDEIIQQHSLATPGDISTASADSGITFDLSGQMTSYAFGLTILPTLDKFYAMKTNTDQIFQYSIAES